MDQSDEHQAQDQSEEQAIQQTETEEHDAEAGQPNDGNGEAQQDGGNNETNEGLTEDNSEHVNKEDKENAVEVPITPEQTPEHPTESQEGSLGSNDEFHDLESAADSAVEGETPDDEDKVEILTVSHVQVGDDASNTDSTDVDHLVAAVPGPPALPARSAHAAPPPLPPRKRAPFFWLKTRSDNSSSSGEHDHSSTLPLQSKRSSSTSLANYDLLLSRLDANKEGVEQAQATEKEATLHGIQQLRQDFEAVKSGHGYTEDEEINWEFWTLVVNDYSYVAHNKPTDLSLAIAAGFPAELRGLIWQLIASSKNSPLEELYYSIVLEDSVHEKAIKRDLSRTSFVQNASSESLFKIIKAYTLFDPEVGYTQGMAFIAVPLLINMSEPEAFCLLVKLMKDYDLRSMFLADMPGLHLRLYQFDRILEDTLPEVYAHLSRQGVRSSMYASQWFLTLFAYKFPLQIVSRIFDLVIAEGIEAILRFAVALIRRAQSDILTLEFDRVLPFLKEKIFDFYLDSTPHYASGPVYRVNDLVADAYQVKILPLTLHKYEQEYAEIHRIERERVEEVEGLRASNGQLTLQVRRLETSLAALNKEHIEVANEMVQGKLLIAKLQDDNEDLVAELTELKKEREEGVSAADVELTEKAKQLEADNGQLLETKERLETQLNNLEKELVDTKMQLADLDGQHDMLKNRWNELKKALED